MLMGIDVKKLETFLNVVMSETRACRRTQKCISVLDTQSTRSFPAHLLSTSSILEEIGGFWML